MNTQNAKRWNCASGAGTVSVLSVLRALIFPNVFALIGLLLVSFPAIADTPVALYQSIAGNINITGTGGTLRTQSDAGNSCLVTNNGSMTLSGVPAGATVRTAYLYWAGSGGDPQGGVGTDYNVTFNGTAVTADRTYTAWYNAGGGNVVYFFGGVKDVTSQVTGNGVYTFSNLTVQTANVGGGGQYCASAAVLSAYSLLVIYDDPAEILHVVNIWEGFQGYRGAAITLTPTNFTVPTPAPVTALSSRILIFTWEGDSGNSGAMGGFNENLTFCSPTPCAGVALTDAFNPLNNQFNSTIDMPPSGPFSGIDTSWGNDLDMYDLTTRVPAGAASAQSVYSSGGDLVILMNQTMSIANVPVADLAITKTHSGDFAVGQNGVYTLGVANNGPNSATGTITVTDTLPAGLTYSSATGTGWTCGAAGQTVTCTRPGPLANGATAPDITLTVSVGAAAFPGVTNTVSVTSGDFDNIAANSTNVGDPTTVIAPDLSTSAKTWQDLNGGDQDPNDILQYTISIIESAGVLATGVTVTDTFPAMLTNLSVVTCPAGATCNFVGQTLTVSNLTVAAGGTANVIISSMIAGGTAAGTLIDNCATITVPVGAGAAPCASTVTVSASAIPVKGNKQLYFYGGATPALSRSTAGNTANVIILNGAIQTWTHDIAMQLPMTLDTASANVQVNLWLSNTTNGRTRRVRVTLSCGAITLGPLTPNITLNIAPRLITFNFPYAGTQTCAQGNAWTFTLDNYNFNRDLTAYPVNGTASYAYIPSQNVINVGPVTAYNAPYPGGSAPASFTTGTVYLRTTVTDPFGSADIASAAITIEDPASALKESLVSMTTVTSDASSKTFEHPYLPVPPAVSGFWTATVIAQEGLVSEGTPTDSGIGTFKVEPSLMLIKSAVAVWDPINLGAGPKIIPGAEIVYSLNLQNSSYGSVDGNSLVIADAIPANTVMCAAAACFNPPVQTSCATPPCGLSFAYPADVAYTCSTPALPCPNPDAAGWSANVTGISINPKNALYGTAVPASPIQYNLQFKVRIQ